MVSQFLYNVTPATTKAAIAAIAMAMGPAIAAIPTPSSLAITVIDPNKDKSGPNAAANPKIASIPACIPWGGRFANPSASFSIGLTAFSSNGTRLFMASNNVVAIGSVAINTLFFKLR